MLPLSKLFKTRTQEDGNWQNAQGDLERGHGREQTPPLPSTIFQEPPIPAYLNQGAYSAPTSSRSSPVALQSSPSPLPDTENLPETNLERIPTLFQSIAQSSNENHSRTPFCPVRFGAAMERLETNSSSNATRESSRDFDQNKTTEFPLRQRVRIPTKLLPPTHIATHYSSSKFSDVDEDDNQPAATANTGQLLRRSQSLSAIRNATFFDCFSDECAASAASKPGADPVSHDQNRPYARKLLPQAATSQGLFEGNGAYEREKEYDQYAHERTIPDQTIQAATSTPRSGSECLGEYAWSPKPSEDGIDHIQEPSTLIEPSSPLNVHIRNVSDSISSTDMSWLLSASDHLDEHARSNAPSPPIHVSRPALADDRAPMLKVFIPAGDLDTDSDSGLLGTSYCQSSQGARIPSDQIIRRFSGIIPEGSSQRAMSDADLTTSVRSIEAIINANLRTSLSGSGSHPGVFAAVGDKESKYQNKMSEADYQDESIVEAGPGDFQTSSSQSTNFFRVDDSSCESRARSQDAHSSSDISFRQIRSPTPPLLYGRRALTHTKASGQSTGASELGLSVDPRQLGRAMKAKDMSKNDHIGPFGPGERDWETVSDMKEYPFHSDGDDTGECRAGSSLADNSDSGNLSLGKQTHLRPQYLRNHRVIQHPALPRHNQSYILVKDNQTGQEFSVPRSETELLSRMPSLNASTFASDCLRRAQIYHHPTPLAIGHDHPFRSRPPQIMPAPQVQASAENSRLNAEGEVIESGALSSDTSGELRSLHDQQVNKSMFELTTPASKSHNADINGNQHEFGSKERSYRSSTWVSTLSEDESATALPELPGGEGSFMKLANLGRKGNVTGTPEGTGLREVGSSLADGSSPGAQFSSSPAPLTSPQSQYATTQKVVQPGTSTVPHTPDTANSTAHEAMLIFPEESMPSTLDEWLKFLPARPRRSPRTSMPCNRRRRRSSSESEAAKLTAPSARITTALESPISRRLANSKPGLLQPDTASQSQYEESTQGSDLPSVRGRQPHQAHVDDRDTQSPESRSLRDANGRVYTDVPRPEFVHPVYGRDLPWEREDHPDRLHHDRSRAKFRSRPALRPIARVESPHLHPTPRQQTMDLLARQRRISRAFLIMCCIVPFFGIIFGTGYADGAMSWITGGEVEEFCEDHKLFGLVWGTFLCLGPIIAVAVWALLTLT